MTTKLVADLEPGDLIVTEYRVPSTWRVESVEPNPKRMPDSDWTIPSHVVHMTLVEAEDVPEHFDHEIGAGLGMTVISNG